MTNSESQQQLRTAIKEIGNLIPPGDRVILVEQNEWNIKSIGDSPAIPFRERDGEYYGPPIDDDDAIREFDRLRRSRGANFIVFGWPGFWLLDYYAGFQRYLWERFRCIFNNERLVVFDLRTETIGQNPARSARIPFSKDFGQRRHYQPTFTTINPIGELIHKGERKCVDRAEMILADLRDLGIAKASLLDIGCNIGFFCHYFQSRGYECTGYEDNSHVDIRRFTDENSVETAERLSLHYGVSPKFHAESAVTLLESTAAFDVVLCLSVLHHWFIGYGYSSKDKMNRDQIERGIRRLYDMTRMVIYFEFGDVREDGWAPADVPKQLQRITGTLPVRIGASDGFEGNRDIWRLTAQ